MIDSDFRRLSPTMLRAMRALAEPGAVLYPGLLSGWGCRVSAGEKSLPVGYSTLRALDRRGLVVRRSRRAFHPSYRLSAYGRSVLVASAKGRA